MTEATQDVAVARKGYPCRAHGCEMTGALDGVCSYHWSAASDDWQTVTSLMFQQRPLVREINCARRLFSDINSDARLVLGGHADALERLRGHLSQSQVAFLREKPVANYHGFLHRLEMLLSHEVLRGLNKKREEQRKHQPVRTRTPADIFNEMYP